MLLLGDGSADAEWPIDTFVVCPWSHDLADNLSCEPTSVFQATRTGIDWEICVALSSALFTRCGQ